MRLFVVDVGTVRIQIEGAGRKDRGQFVFRHCTEQVWQCGKGFDVSSSKAGVVVNMLPENGGRSFPPCKVGGGREVRLAAL
jgi:hypothetical protein